MRRSCMAMVCLFCFLLLSGAACGSDPGGRESAESTLQACQDDQDNDGDGATDCFDPDCRVFVICLGSGDVRLREGGPDPDLEHADAGPGGDGALADAAGRTDAPAQDGKDKEHAATDTAQIADNRGGFCDPCGYGSLKGRVCAPSEQIYVAGASITIETTDCSGQPVTLQAISGIDGTYTFDSVPCGYQTVHIEKGSFVYEYEVPIQNGKLMDVSGADIKMCFGASIVSIAVVWGQWDEMNDIVDRLGFDYDWYYYEDDLYADDPDWENVEAVQMLRDPAWLAQYNILVLNCGSAYQKWAVEFPDMVDNIRDWVLSGGSLYSSDLAWIMSEKAFPDAVDYYGIDDKGYMASDGPQIIDGNQDCPAFLVDAELAAYVGGGEIQVHYGPGPLISVAQVAAATSVHAKAHIKQCQGFFDNCTSGVKLDEDQPVILSFKPGSASGRVVYSCFHVDEQEEQEKYDKILYYMIFML